MAIDLRNLGSLQQSLQAAQQPGQTTDSLIGSALRSGAYSAVGSFAGALAAAGRVFDPDQDRAQRVADTAKSYNDASQAAGRSDIENRGYTEGGVGGFFQKGLYDATKSLPALVGAVATGAALAPVIPEAGAAAVGGRLVSLAPRLFAGESAAGLGQGILGAAGYTVPSEIGSLYNEAGDQARKRGEAGASASDALQAAALGVPAGLLQAVVPGTGAGSIFGEKAAGTLLSRVARGFGANAAAGAVGAGASTAAADTFDPSLSVGDRAGRIVGAAVQGAAMGGLFGGLFGLAPGHGGTSPKDAGAVTNADLTATVDSVTKPQAPIEPQAYPGAAPAQAPADGAPAPSSAPVAPQSVVPGRAYDGGLVNDFYGFTPQAPTQEALVERFMQNMPGTTGLPRPDAPAPLRLTDQRPAVYNGDGPPAELTGTDRPSVNDGGFTGDDAIRLPDQSAFDVSGAIRLPDRGDMDFSRSTALVPIDRPLDPREAVDPTTRNVAAYKALQLEAAQRRMGITVDPVHPEEPPVAPLRLDEPAQLGPVARPSEYVESRLQGTPDEALFGPDVGEAVGDKWQNVIQQQYAESRAAELERDRAQIRKWYPDLSKQLDLDLTPTGSAGPRDAEGAPRTVADRVLSAAQDLTGGTGGEAKIADIRKAMSDQGVHSADVDNALRAIHGDDTDNVLTQAPRGQRTGVDGVSVQGQGRFHNLSVEPRETRDAGVQERGAAPAAARDGPGSVSQAGGGDAAGGAPARASAEAGAAVRREGAADRPGAQAEAAPVAAKPTTAEAARALRDAGEPVTSAKIKEVQAGRKPLNDTDKVMGAARDLLRENRDGTGMVSMENVRAALGDMPRARQDAVLTDLVRKGDLNIQRDDNNAGLATRNTARRDAAVSIGGDPRHFLVDAKPEAPASKIGTVLGSKVMANVGAAREARAAEREKRPPKFSSQTPDTGPDFKAQAAAIVKMREAMRSKSGELPNVERPRSAAGKAMAGQAPGARRIVETDARVGMSPAERDQAQLRDIQGKGAGASATDKAALPGLMTRIGDRTLEAMQRENSAEPAVAADRSRLSTLVEKTRTAAESREMMDIVGRQTDRQNAVRAETTAAETLSSAGVPSGPVSAPAPAQPDTIKAKSTFGDYDRPAVYGVREAQRDFRDVTSRLKPEVQGKVHFVPDEASLPADFRAQAVKQGYNLDTIPAAYYRGEVYVRGDLQPSRGHIEDAIAHEVFGHMGSVDRVYDALGSNANARTFDASMAAAFDRAGGLDGLEKIARKYGVWDGTANDGVGLKGYLPDDVSNLSQHEKSNLVDELIAHAAASTEIGPKQRALMEYVGAIKHVIADFLRRQGLTTFADRMDRFDENDVAKWLKDNRVAMSDEPPADAIDMASLSDERLRLAGFGAGHMPIRPKMIQGQLEEAGGPVRAGGSLQELADKIGGKANLPGMKRAGGKVFDSIRSGYGMTRAWGDKIPAMVAHYNLAHQRSVIESRVNEAHGAAAKALLDVSRQSKVVAGEVQELMQRATSANIDPTRPWSDHTWLMPDPANVTPEATARTSELKAEHDALSSMWDKLGQKRTGITEDGAGQRAYRLAESLGRGDQYARMVTEMETLHGLLFDPERPVPGFEMGSAAKFLDASGAHADPAAYADFWKNEFETRQAAFEKYAKDNRIEGKGDSSPVENLDPENKPAAADASAAARQLSDIGDMLDRHMQADKAQAEGPYFHLGRQGDFFGSMHLATDADGRVPDETWKALQDELGAARMSDVAINRLSGNNHVFIRVKTEDELERLNAVIDKLADGDHLDPNKELSAGPIADGQGLTAADVPMLDRALSYIDAKFPSITAADGKLDPVREKLRDSMRAQWRAALIDILPEKSIRKVYQQREDVQGYSKDQLANNVFRGQVTARAIATAATRPGSLDAVAQMYSQARDAKYSNRDDALSLNDHVDAYLNRTEAASVRASSSFVDTARNFVHRYYISLSPAYVAMQLSQLGTLTLPELGSRYGYAKAMGSLASAAPDAYRLMAAIAREGHFDTGAVTEKVLQRAGLSAEKTALIRDLVGSGHIELGSYTRSMGAAADGQPKGAFGRALDYANGTGTMAEVAGRLVAALASHDLHTSDPSKSGFPDSHAYAAHTLAESMFNWGSYDTPKLFTAGGPLGTAGPLVFQFHQFATKLFEKVAHESYNGFVARGEDAARSRAFMYGHGAAVMFLSGAFGLPMAGWAAAAMTRLTGVFNEGQDYDVQAHFRTFLAGLVGKDVGEIISKGVPRYLGVDLSDLGDKDFLPMQSLLEDHREFKDAATAYLAQGAGSTAGLLVNSVNAMHLMTQGRIGEALARALPTEARNLAKAYRMSQYGYLNSQGEKMPIPATAQDVAKQALGFTPGALAEEEDRDQVIRNAKEDRSGRTQLIKQQLALAVERRDPAEQAKWMSEVQAFDRDPMNKGQPIGPTIPQFLAQRQQAMAYSRSTGNPLGLSPKDIGGRGLIQF